MWFWKIIRRFFMSLDTVLFNFIGTLYDLLLSISRTSILSQGDIAEFARRIELLLGIFMLFKLSFSLITYIVNPEDFSSKDKGFGKLIQNGVVSLVLLVVVPYIFSMAYNLQAKVLEGNILGRLIFEEENNNSGSEQNNYLASAGENMAFTTMLPFFMPNTGADIKKEGADLTDCINIYEDKDTFNKDCEKALANAGMGTTDLNDYVNGIENRSLGLTFRASAALASDDDSESFIIDYKAPLSTVVAVIICLLLVTFCIDIGLRSIKLAFLQLVYPIPVIAYMDPKGGKDGIFKKWYQMCFSTYLSLFLRLLALYFGIYIISKLSSGAMYDIINGSQITNGWVMIFIIIGVLMFIKQLPTILKNLGINIEGDGKFTLNPLKKIEEGALGGKTISRLPKAAAGAAMGLGIGAVGMATGAGIGKAFTGMASGLADGLKGKKIGEIHKGQIDANQRLREARANGSTFLGRRGVQIRNLIGAEPRSIANARNLKTLEEQKNFYDQQAGTQKSIRDRILSELRTNADYDDPTKGSWYAARNTILGTEAQLEAAKAAGNESEIARLTKELNKAEQLAYETVINSNNAMDDAVVASEIRKFNIRNDENKKWAEEAGLANIDLTTNVANNSNELKDSKKNAATKGNEVDDTIYRVKSSRKAQAASANENAVKH